MKRTSPLHRALRRLRDRSRLAMLGALGAGILVSTFVSGPADAEASPVSAREQPAAAEHLTPATAEAAGEPTPDPDIRPTGLMPSPVIHEAVLSRPALEFDRPMNPETDIAPGIERLVL